VSGSRATIIPLVAGGAGAFAIAAGVFAEATALGGPALRDAFAWRFATCATSADGDGERALSTVADALAPAGAFAVCEVTPAKASTPARVASATDTLRRGRINQWS